MLDEAPSVTTGRPRQQEAKVEEEQEHGSESTAKETGRQGTGRDKIPTVRDMIRNDERLVTGQGITGVMKQRGL